MPWITPPVPRAPHWISAWHVLRRIQNLFLHIHHITNNKLEFIPHCSRTINMWLENNFWKLHSCLVILRFGIESTLSFEDDFILWAYAVRSSNMIFFCETVCNRALGCTWNRPHKMEGKKMVSSSWSAWPALTFLKSYGRWGHVFAASASPRSWPKYTDHITIFRCSWQPLWS